MPEANIKTDPLGVRAKTGGSIAEAELAESLEHLYRHQGAFKNAVAALFHFLSGCVIGIARVTKSHIHLQVEVRDQGDEITKIKRFLEKEHDIKL